MHVLPAGGRPFDYPITASSVVIGRSSGCDLVLPDRFLSRDHARLFVAGDRLMLEDLGSHNGTFLNGALLEGPRVVSPGDRIRLSTTVIMVGSPSPRRRADATESGIAGATVVRDATDLLPDLAQPPEESSDRGELLWYAQRLALLNEVHRALAGTPDLAHLLELILDRLFDHFRPDEAAIFLRREDDTFHMVAGRTTGHGRPELEYRTLLREVAEEGRAVVVLDAQDDSRFADSASIRAAGVRSLLAAPLLDSEGSMGMIALAASAARRHFGEIDLEMLVSLASVATLRMRNVAMVESVAAHRRLEQEIALARSIQVALLPPELPPIAGYELHTGNIPSRQVSGDFYEVVERRDGREVVLLLADVSGKGVGAAMLTATIEALLAAPIEDGLPPEAICTRVDRMLHLRTAANKYTTMFLAVLEPATGRLTYVNAGHLPALVLRRSGELERLAARSPPVGLLPNAVFLAGDCALGPGDLLVSFSDGIAEAEDPDGHEYGVERIAAFCRERFDAPLAALAEGLEKELGTFVRGEPIPDDRTVMLLRREAP